MITFGILLNTARRMSERILSSREGQAPGEILVLTEGGELHIKQIF